MNSADIIFIGNIITVDDSNPTVEALAVKNGKIVAVGSHEAVLQWKGEGTEIIDLEDKTLMPGFIEPHSHPIISALLYDFIDVSGFNNPNGMAVIKKLQDAAVNAKPGEWITAFGYDPILTRDLKALNADFLDDISSTNPIFVMIQSMHTVFVNHKAFEVTNITKDTRQPGGGGYFVKDKSGNLTGMVTEQSAIFPFMAAVLQSIKKDYKNLVKKQLLRYAKAGYTTVGAAGVFPVFPNAVEILEELIKQESSPIRMVIMNTIREIKRIRSMEPGSGNDQFRDIGVKFWYDGSPYTGTMFLDQPYLNSELMRTGLGIQKETCGESVISKERLKRLVQKYHNAGWQIIIHGQGDRATREIIDIYELVLTNSPREDHRHRIEHCALFSEDQIERAAKLGITPSWHINHIYYYGEALRDEIIGPERANHLMQIATALKYGHRNSLHNDSPMYRAEPLKLLRTAVTRKTRKNVIIGADQPINIEEGIKALTINPAWQMFMEDKVGSLEVGKLADLIVLSENPMEINPDRLDQIQVLETYKGGRALSLSKFID